MVRTNTPLVYPLLVEEGLYPHDARAQTVICVTIVKASTQGLSAGLFGGRGGHGYQVVPSGFLGNRRRCHKTKDLAKTISRDTKDLPGK